MTTEQYFKAIDISPYLPNPEELSVIHLGCGNYTSGIGDQLRKMPFRLLCSVDIWPGELEQMPKDMEAKEHVIVLGDITKVPYDMPFDVCLLLDVLEHLDKPMQFLDSLPYKKIVVFSPLEFTPEKYNAEANPYRAHLTTLCLEDFQVRGFKTTVIKDFHKFPDGHSNDAFWAVRG